MNNRYITDYFAIEEAIRTEAFSMTEKHFHPECEIYYLLEGAGNYFIESDSYEVQAGTLVILNKNQVHRSCFNDCDYHHRLLIELKAEHFEGNISNLCGRSLLDFFQNYEGLYQIKERQRPYVKNLLTQLLHETKNKYQNYELMIAMKLAELMIYLERPEHKGSHFLRQSNAPTEMSLTVQSAMQHIHQHLNQPLSLETIASQLFLNKSYLSRIFKEMTQMTVHEYINLQRVKEAQRLMENTALSVSEIAEQVGYNTPAYFERVFKKYFECTPKKYQQRVLAQKATNRT